MNSLIKGLLSIIGIIMFIPVMVVIVALLCVSLIGGYIGVVVTTYKWIGIVLVVLVGLVIAKWLVKTILGFLGR